MATQTYPLNKSLLAQLYAATAEVAKARGIEQGILNSLQVIALEGVEPIPNARVALDIDKQVVVIEYPDEPTKDTGSSAPPPL